MNSVYFLCLPVLLTPVLAQNYQCPMSGPFERTEYPETINFCRNKPSDEGIPTKNIHVPLSDQTCELCFQMDLSADARVVVIQCTRSSGYGINSYSCSDLNLVYNTVRCCYILNLNESSDVYVGVFFPSNSSFTVFQKSVIIPEHVPSSTDPKKTITPEVRQSPGAPTALTSTLVLTTSVYPNVTYTVPDGDGNGDGIGISFDLVIVIVVLLSVLIVVCGIGLMIFLYRYCTCIYQYHHENEPHAQVIEMNARDHPPEDDPEEEDSPHDDDHQQDPPHDDGHQQDPPHDDDHQQDPPHEDGHQQDPPHDDDHQQDPPHDDGLQGSPPLPDSCLNPPPNGGPQGTPDDPQEHCNQDTEESKPTRKASGPSSTTLPQQEEGNRRGHYPGKANNRDFPGGPTDAVVLNKQAQKCCKDTSKYMVDIMKIHEACVETRRDLHTQSNESSSTDFEGLRTQTNESSTLYSIDYKAKFDFHEAVEERTEQPQLSSMCITGSVWNCAGNYSNNLELCYIRPANEQFNEYGVEYGGKYSEGAVMAFVCERNSHGEDESCILSTSNSIGDKDGHKVTKVLATIGSPPDRWQDISYMYADLKIIGNGSFGVVYQTRLVETNDLVAVNKVLQDKRFKNRGLRIMRRLYHFNIIRLQFFYTGGDKLFRSLAYYVHANDVYHRDIKPQNLLLNPETGVLKLCDFGRCTGTYVVDDLYLHVFTSATLVKGEPNVSYICSQHYRAPEFIFGATDHTCDIVYTRHPHSHNHTPSRPYSSSSLSSSTKGHIIGDPLLELSNRGSLKTECIRT